MYILLEFSLLYTNIGYSPISLCLQTSPVAYWMIVTEDGNLVLKNTFFAMGYLSALWSSIINTIKGFHC